MIQTDFSKLLANNMQQYLNQLYSNVMLSHYKDIILGKQDEMDPLYALREEVKNGRPEA